MDRILVVEDDVYDTELLCHVLAGAGLKYVTCATADAAREHVEREKFAAAMINLTLSPPEIDGVPLIRWLRARSPNLFIVVVTGADDPRRRAQAIEAGATGFFTKPYTSEDNALLIRQLSAGQALYEQGKAVIHKRTSIGGAIQSAGTTLMGVGIVPSLTSVTAAEELKWVVISGFVLKVFGELITSFSAADARVVNAHMKMCPPSH